MAVACSLEGYAQQSYDWFNDGALMGEQPRSRTQMGLMAGASYMFSSADVVDLQPTLGVRLALFMSRTWYDAVAVQMEVAYLYNKIEADKRVDVKSNVVEVPILFSYRGLGPMRFSLGPQFSIAGTARYDSLTGVGERIEFGRLRSSVGYVASVGVELSRSLLVEARYTGNFAKSENYFEGREFQTTSGWLSLNVAFTF